jgi:hypothetical protein
MLKIHTGNFRDKGKPNRTNVEKHAQKPNQNNVEKHARKPNQNNVQRETA